MLIVILICREAGVKKSWTKQELVLEYIALSNIVHSFRLFIQHAQQTKF